METKTIPVHSYSELASYVEAFAAGKFRFLAVWGTGGLGKTETVLSVMNQIPEPSLEEVEEGDESDMIREWVKDWAAEYDRPSCRYIKGNLSAVELYSDLWRYQDQTFVLDDTDLQESGAQAVKLLKSVCESRGENKVFWRTQNKQLAKEGIPREFKTKSRVLFLTNDWTSDTAHLAAVADRGIVLRFTPSAAAVHQQVLDHGICTDAEILEYVGGNLDRIVTPSIRSYLTAVELKDIGKDWKGYLDRSFNPTTDYEIWIQIHESGRFRMKKDEIKAFTDRTGASRRTWFNYQDRYKESQAAKGMPEVRKEVPKPSPAKRERPDHTLKGEVDNSFDELADKWDFYATDRESIDYLLDRETFDGPISEPCSGDGAIVEVLEERGNEVVASDLRTSGIVGTGGVNLYDLDHATNIVTNPPYTDFGNIVEHMVDIADRKVACLLPLRFLGSEERREFLRNKPPARIYALSRRPTFYIGGRNGRASKASFDFAWFVWDRDSVDKMQLIMH